MKAVIQCSASKQGKLWVWQDRPVKFVAHPELCAGSDESLYCRPDDLIPGFDYSWRRKLDAYNRLGSNPNGLSKAGDLYKPREYRELVDALGWENTFILSAGWGLVQADFLLPSYDITFSSRADRYKRRTKHDRYDDYNHLAVAGIGRDEGIHFFGGNDYLPLYYDLTRHLPGRKVIHHKSKRIQRQEGYVYVKYTTTRSTNWHYSCVRDFIKGRVKQ